jgi:putative transposase
MGRRIKVVGRGAVYHCISRVVAGEFLLDDLCKEQLRKMLWQQAQFCGVEVITYCVLDNHFHILVRVPVPSEVTDTELMSRVRALYSGRGTLAVLLESMFKENGRLDSDLRRALLARMYDVSVFLRELKKRFSIWFNKRNERFGTLWAERFKSVLVEDRPSLVSLVAAYVDLNPVRAGLVDDPKDYRFCGYAEAVAGSELARNGISGICSDSWAVAAKNYRKELFVRGGVAGQSGKVLLKREAILKVLKENGGLSRASCLRLRVRYFTDGGVLGTNSFVDEMFVEFRDRFSRNRKSGARKLRGVDIEDISVARDLQVDVFS